MLIKKILGFFEDLVSPFPEDEAGVPPSDFVKFILFYSKGLLKFFLAIAVLSVVVAIGEALFFTCMGLIVDWTQDTDPDTFMRSHAHQLVLMLVMAGVILPVATFLHSLILHQTISSNYPMMIRWQFHRYLLGQSLSFFTEEYAGRVANKVMQTAMAVRTCVLKLIDVFVHMGTYIVVMLFMLVDADLLMAFPLIVWLVMFSIAVYYFVPKIRTLSSKTADSRSDMVGRVVDSYMNIATVKLFGGRGREELYAKESMNDYRQAEYESLRILTLYDISVQSLNYLLLISITILALALWAHDIVTPGAIAVSIAIAIRMINMSRWMMWEVGMIFENIGMVYDGINTISRPRMIEDADNPRELKNVQGNIEFRDVTFGYFQDRKIFEHLNLSIRAREKVGIVGPSGVGKSTLISLLLRFYDVESGEITVDGVNIRNVKQDDLRDCFAMVTQDPSLMHRSVGENICYGAEFCSIDELQHVAYATDSMSFIQDLSDYKGNRGFATLVGERGAKLSGGQRQKIALARVIMKDAPILILDEATSALDSETESIIQKNLEKIMENRTVIAIAHRLSTLVRMDRIIVLDKGGIVGSGSHEELLAQGGLYKLLWDRQSNGFIGD